MALTALQGCHSADLSRSLALAEQYLSAPVSIEARSWLTIALASYGRKPGPPNLAAKFRTTPDYALALLAHTACAGQNAFEVYQA